MLDWLHNAINWMGSILLFITLCVIYAGVIFVVVDETLDWLFGAGKDDETPGKGVEGQSPGRYEE